MKKVIAVVLCVLMCAAVMAGCGQSKEKTIIVATNAEFPPYEYYENGKPTGIDIEIMQAICDKLGYKMEVEDMAFGSIITSVATGKADVGAAAITVDDDRKKEVNFTDSYATGVQVIIVKKDSAITSVDDLYGEDVKIGVQQDTTGDIYGTGDFGDDHIIRYNKGADAVQALVSGKCSAVLIDNNPAKAFVAQNEDLVILETPYAEEDYAFEISYKNEKLYGEINGALKELKADGTIQKILDKYINAD